jgi:hypothetical protein
MQADQSSTRRTCPFLLFFQLKLICTSGFDSNGVFDQADLIPLPVPFIDLLDAGAGKGEAFGTVPA